MNIRPAAAAAVAADTPSPDAARPSSPGDISMGSLFVSPPDDLAPMDVEGAEPGATPPRVEFDQAMMDELVAAASQNVWGVPSLRPMQLDAARVMLHPRRPDQIILVQPTGAGKSHIVRLLGVIEKGIVLVFVPLLALSADVAEKFKNAVDTWGTVDVHHLDEVYTNSKGNYRRLLEKIRCMDRRTSSTLFLFVSPHFLVLHPDARDALLLAGRERTLRLVVADEVHLMVQHGMSFRAEIRALRDLFWIKLFRPSDSAAHPKFIGMTATMPEAYVAHLTFLTTLPFPDSNIFRASAYDFQQRSIGMAQFVCGVSDYARTGLKQVVEFLHKNPDRSTVLFTNARARAETLTRQLEAKLNEAHVNADVIVVHGNLDKNEKFWRVRIFCAPQGTHVEDVKCRALVATNAINVGIDDHTVDFGVRFGLPRDLATFIQERGRGSRVPGAPSTFVVFLDLGSYEYLVTRTLRSLDNDDVNATNDTTRGGTQGYNSAISPFKSVGSHDATTNSVDMTSYRLKREGKIRLRDRELQEMGDVTKFFFLNNGCQHILSELYLSHGKFVVPPAELPSELRPCDQQCAICSGKWHQVHLPVYREWVVAMLEIRGRELLPLETLSREDRISNLIWGDIYWTEKIFDRPAGRVKKGHVDALLFSLVAAGILEVVRDKRNNVVWQVAREASANEHQYDWPAKYMDDSCWKGINLFEAGRERRRKVIGIKKKVKKKKTKQD